MTVKRSPSERASKCAVSLPESGKPLGRVPELGGKGYEILPVHPDAAEIDGVRCYRSLAELPKPAGGLVVVVPPVQTERLVQEAHEAGIDRV